MSILRIPPRMTSILRSGLFALIVAVGILGSPRAAHAQGLAIVVTTSADNVTADGLCSLREAIVNANRNWQYYRDCTGGFSSDGIFFSNTLGTATITLNSPLPAVNDPAGLTIGGGSDITVSGNGSHRVFLVSFAGSLTLDSLTVSLGRNLSNGGGAYNNGGSLTITSSTFLENGAANGGGIYNRGGSLTITNSSFRRNGAGNNVPGNNDGGGVYSADGMLTVTNSTFSGNNAYSEGGGIYIASGTTVITGSTFSANGDRFIYGGGIYAQSGSLTITTSTFSNNMANLGGGVFVWSGTSSIANSTFAGNSSNHGGGIITLGNTAISNSTFSRNTSTAGGGAGISNGGALNLYNTILANSTPGSDCFNNGGAVVTGSNNLIEIDAAAPNTCGTASLTGDPVLGSLVGSPAYFPLGAGSPAINAGDDAICAAAPVNNASQNGVTRPQGAHCDIGSYEG